jgi:hypothetical protein
VSAQQKAAEHPSAAFYFLLLKTREADIAPLTSRLPTKPAHPSSEIDRLIVLEIFLLVKICIKALAAARMINAGAPVATR